MFIHNVRHQMLIGLLLVLLMLVTRGHHVLSFLYMPDASWAVFFLAGMYFNAQWIFLLLCLLAALVDWAAISIGGVSSYCVTPAYAMLLPAYASLWLGGRWYAMHHRNTLPSKMLLVITAVITALLAELFSSGGFYFLGGRFNDPTYIGFIQRLAYYFPQSLGTYVLYLSAAGLLRSLFARRLQPHCI